MNAVLWEGVLVIEVSLFWALVLVLAGFLWVGGGIWEAIEALISSARPGRTAPLAHQTGSGGQITVNLIIVLAVITAAVGVLAYEWYHAQAAKTHHPPTLSRGQMIQNAEDPLRSLGMSR